MIVRAGNVCCVALVNWHERVEAAGSGISSARTPARLRPAGRAGPSFRTATHLQLREDHAAARDAVQDELDAKRDLPDIGTHLKSRSRARNKEEFSRRPDLGRRLDDSSRELVSANVSAGPDVQVVIGDGLSATAVARQVPALYPMLTDTIIGRSWSLGTPCAIHYCRVGVLNDIGALLDPGSRGVADRRATWVGDGGKPVGIHGFSAPSGSYRCQSQSDFQHSCPRDQSCRGGAANCYAGRRYDAATAERLRFERGLGGLNDLGAEFRRRKARPP